MIVVRSNSGNLARNTVRFNSTKRCSHWTISSTAPRPTGIGTSAGTVDPNSFSIPRLGNCSTGAGASVILRRTTMRALLVFPLRTSAGTSQSPKQRRTSLESAHRFLPRPDWSARAAGRGRTMLPLPCDSARPVSKRPTSSSAMEFSSDRSQPAPTHRHRESYTKTSLSDTCFISEDSMECADRDRQMRSTRIARAHEYRQRAKFDPCLDDRSEIRHFEIKRARGVRIIHRIAALVPIPYEDGRHRPLSARRLDGHRRRGGSSDIAEVRSAGAHADPRAEPEPIQCSSQPAMATRLARHGRTRLPSGAGPDDPHSGPRAISGRIPLP